MKSKKKTKPVVKKSTTKKKTRTTQDKITKEHKALINTLRKAYKYTKTPVPEDKPASKEVTVLQIGSFTSDKSERVPENGCLDDTGLEFKYHMVHDGTHDAPIIFFHHQDERHVKLKEIQDIIENFKGEPHKSFFNLIVTSFKGFFRFSK
jgi:hypothetical protein